MREIKFRGWHKERKEYINFETIYVNHDGVFIDYEEKEFIKEIGTVTTTKSFKNGVDVILEQYTGLEDKNRKEIYEGDIIKGIDKDFKEEVEGDVFYNNSFGLYMISKNYRRDYRISLYDLSDYKIIGNIHEGIDSDE